MFKESHWIGPGVLQFLTCCTRWTEVFMICGFEVPSWPRPVLAILKEALSSSDGANARATWNDVIIEYQRGD